MATLLPKLYLCQQGGLPGIASIRSDSQSDKEDIRQYQQATCISSVYVAKT